MYISHPSTLASIGKLLHQSHHEPLFTTLACIGRTAAADRPNIIFILADDIGCGDFGCYGATKVQTPNVDRLAAQGLRMTDAQSMASVRTPSRYSFLTGEYAFRKKGTGIASGVECLLIDTNRTTVPSLLKRAGYTTGIVGEWHLALGTAPTDYNHDIKPGTLEIGSSSITASDAARSGPLSKASRASASNSAARASAACAATPSSSSIGPSARCSPSSTS